MSPRIIFQLINSLSAICFLPVMCHKPPTLSRYNSPTASSSCGFLCANDWPPTKTRWTDGWYPQEQLGRVCGVQHLINVFNSHKHGYMVCLWLLNINHGWRSGTIESMPRVCFAIRAWFQRASPPIHVSYLNLHISTLNQQALLTNLPDRNRRSRRTSYQVVLESASLPVNDSSYRPRAVASTIAGSSWAQSLV